MPWSPILPRVIPLRPLPIHIMLIIHALRVLLGMPLRLLAVKPVLAFCLSELVDLCACEAGEELFGELMGDGLAW